MDQPSSTESNAITLRIRFKSPSLDEFINRYGADVSPGGIFIRTKQPVEVGTSLQFDFALADGSPLLAGLGTVAWVRESDPARANNVPGMGLRFDKLSVESQHTHQTILAEKSRKEGKSLSTPYPPTAFVAPAAKPSPAPDFARPAAEDGVKTEAAPVNLAVTRPAPAVVVKSPPPATAAPAVPVKEPVSEPVNEIDGGSGEFESAGKTEISDKPLDYYLKEAAREAQSDSIGRTSEEAVPASLLDDFTTDAEALPPTKNGPPPAGVLEQSSSPVAAVERASATAKPASGERKIGDGGTLASLLDLGKGNDPVTERLAAPTAEVLEELSAGAPIEETAPEKTEEVSLSPTKPAEAAPEPAAPAAADLGGASLAGDRPPSRNGATSAKPKSSVKVIAGIAVLTAAAAFGVVYLATAKPWQHEAPPESQASVAAVPTPAPTPAPQPVIPAPEPSKPAVAAEPVAQKPAVEEAKPTAGAAAAAKPEAQNSAAEKASDGKSDEKPIAAKADSEAPSAKSAGKPTGRTSGKSGEEKAGAADEGESYHLAFKSSPIGAEVLIDGEYFGRTPCDRRVLDPKKSIAITFRREGYEPHERMIGASDNWVKKGNDRVLTVSANLKKVVKPAAGVALPASPEAKTQRAPEPAPAAHSQAKPAAPPTSAPAKPAAPAPEIARPAAPKPELAKPAASASEPAKPTPAPTPKPPVLKPVPNFDEPSKAKE